MTSEIRRPKVLDRVRAAPSHLAASLRRSSLRVVPAAVLPDSGLIQLGGGEMVPCPGVESLPLAPIARSLGLGSPSLALPSAKVHVLRDVTICPGSRVVRDRDGRVVSESLTADMTGNVSVVEPERPGDIDELPGTVALYRSPWRPHFHTLIDHLPRAALLAQPAMHRVGPITLVHDGPLSPIEELLMPGLLGPQIELLQVDPGRAIRAEQVLLPGYVTRPAAGAIPSWYRRWIDRTVAAVRPEPEGARSLPRRLFVDRTSGTRRVINRVELDRVLEAHGIEAVDLTTLSASEEVRCFRDAELVVGVSGSGLANAVFSRSTRIVELVPGQELLPHFFYLAATKGLPYEYVLSPPDNLRLSAERRLRHDVTVDTEALDRLLSRL